jgi:hypothetical protein
MRPQAAVKLNSMKKPARTINPFVAFDSVINPDSS